MCSLLFQGCDRLAYESDKEPNHWCGEVPNIELLTVDFVDLGCGIGYLPICYLGLPLSSSFKSKEVWGLVVDRVRKRLAGLKAQYLSKGGRVTLIKSVLSSIHVYLYVDVCHPKEVVQQI